MSEEESGVKFISEDAAEYAKLKLDQSMNSDPLIKPCEFSSTEINWIDGFKTYQEVKIKNLELLTEREDGEDSLFLIASPTATLMGKPQLIHENIQKIPMVRRTLQIKKDKSGHDVEYIHQRKFIDDRYDKRFDGQVMDSVCFDFFLYRIVCEHKEHYIFSQKKLPNEHCIFEGMQVDLDDISEINSNLRINKISSIFICKSFESSVKKLDKISLINYVKEFEIDEQKFQDLMFTHPDGNIYEYTDDFNLLRKVQMLSGKYEGYPLHLFKMGPVGTGKTTEAEVIDFKFKEDQGILEAANSTLKVLVPSFKEKPANLGYICKCNRVAIIDEMMKMVESALGHDNSRVSNYFGQMNMLLEHKDRMVGSGNDNSARVQSTSKVCITTNNISGMPTIEKHLAVIDPTTMSRMLVWIQDSEEVNLVYSKTGVREPLKEQSVKSPPHTHILPNTISRDKNLLLSNEKILPLYVGGTGNEKKATFTSCGNDMFLTIYDSCQDFLINFDLLECRKIFEEITCLTRKRMRNVWRARGLHHVILVLDGITKHRCLFRDYDPKFKTKKEDYKMTLKLLKHMVASWATDMSATF
jgi:hypothetical protein